MDIRKSEGFVERGGGTRGRWQEGASDTQTKLKRTRGRMSTAQVQGP